MASPTVVNCVFTGLVNPPIEDLEIYFNSLMPYNIERFKLHTWRPQMITCKTPFATVNIFKKKCVIMGCRRIEEAENACDWIFNELLIYISHLQLRTKTMKTRLPPMNLPQIYQCVRHLEAVYEPELCPAMKIKHLNMTLMIHHTGHVTIFGVKDETLVQQCIDDIIKCLTY